MNLGALLPRSTYGATITQLTLTQVDSHFYYLDITNCPYLFCCWNFHSFVYTSKVLPKYDCHCLCPYWGRSLSHNNKFRNQYKIMNN